MTHTDTERLDWMASGPEGPIFDALGDMDVHEEAGRLVGLDGTAAGYDYEPQNAHYNAAFRNMIDAAMDGTP